MKIVIEPKSRPCPGVERALSMTEDVLGREENLFSVGRLIHNKREIDRLEDLGLKMVERDVFNGKADPEVLK